MNENRLNWETVTGGRTAYRAARAARVLAELSPSELEKARLEECQDEFTGERYGRAKCRAGKAVKLGNGGKNHGSRYAYQVWLVWA